MAERVRRLHTGIVNSVAISPDRKYIASGSNDNTVKLWRVSLFLRGEDALVRTMWRHFGHVFSVAFSPDGQYLASASGDKTVKLWHVETGECTRTIEEHSDFVVSVAFSPNGKTLASGSYDKTVKLWRVDQILDGSNPLIRTMEHSDWVMCVAFSPDGQYLASGSGLILNGTVKLWRVDRILDGSNPLVRTMEGHNGDVNSVAFSPDGQYLASGSGDNTVKLWHVDRILDGSNPLVRTMEGHSGSVYSVAFSPDGQYLASGSSDDTVKLWSTPFRDMQEQAGGRRDRMYTLMNTIRKTGRLGQDVYQLGQYGGGPHLKIQAMLKGLENNEDPLIHEYNIGHHVVRSVVFLNNRYIICTIGRTIRILPVVGAQTGAHRTIRMFSIPGAAGAQAQTEAEELDFSLLRF